MALDCPINDIYTFEFLINLELDVEYKFFII